MHYAISVFCRDGEKRAKITVAGPRYEFALVMPYDDLRTSAGREMVYAWAMGLFSMPGADIPLTLLEHLLDAIERRYPIADHPLHRPRFRIW